MTQIMNFKRLEVTGATKEEALAKAPFDASFKNATQAYNNWKEKQVNGITDSDKKQFMLDYLAKTTRNNPGIGCYIVVESAVADTRERPYTITDVKNDKGSRKYKTFYQIVDKNTGVVLAQTEKTKAHALALGKQLYIDGYKGNTKCQLVKQVVEGSDVVFTIDYTPSVNAKNGTYVVFGIEND